MEAQMKKFLLSMILCCMALIAITALDLPENDDDILFQVSTLGALQEGVYDGVAALKEIKLHGDFGIGTFDGLDGEMIELDGIFYQVRADGKVYRVLETVKTPFAMITKFNSDKKLYISESMDYKELQELILSLLPTKNIIYAVKLTGEFQYVKTRSVPKQVKPYPRLVEVTKNQPTFEMNNIKGTIMGYWLPEYLAGVNMAGFHFHFLTDDKKGGGHLLEIQMTKGTLEIDYSYGIKLILPAQSDFFKTTFSKDNKNELEKIEK
jgi:acetolactate decarboxylase